MSSAPSVAAGPHVASLARSFALVPPAAVPAVIDCVLASAALSPSELFFSLLKAFPELTKDIRKEDSSKLVPAQSSFLISYTAALFHLVKNPGWCLFLWEVGPTVCVCLLTSSVYVAADISPGAFTFFIWYGFVPLLGATTPDARELLNQFEDLLCDAVIATQSWELMESTLVPLCLRSVFVSCGMTQRKELAVNQWRCLESREVGLLPLTVACNLLSSLLDAAFRERDPWAKTTSQEVELVIGIQTPDAFVQNLMWDLSLTAVDMLLQSLEHRSCAIRLLFPIIFRVLAIFPTFEVLVNGVAHSFSRPCFFKNVWERCITMFSLGHLERVDACCLLSLYFSGFNAWNITNAYEGFDIRAETRLCKEIRRGLVDKDASVRKHSLYILRKLLSDSFWMGSYDSPSLEPAIKSLATGACQDNTLSHSGMTKREKWADKEARSMHVGEMCTLSVNGLGRWKAFFLLYDMLEEYGTHLVEAAWTHQVGCYSSSVLSCD
ncbi:hypothetical protein Taro_018341 [Colocasia esculenta]|uniref:Uncharacterized protein n=1 Tax=Colocasia esculenta TaxID=4460 RepID=A0A843UW19_COLES|nr:hypothetical protein [Colocasia esculenta]